MSKIDYIPNNQTIFFLNHLLAKRREKEQGMHIEDTQERLVTERLKC